MTLEEYNQLGSNFAHCSGANCERANECLQHAAHKMLAKNTRESYAVANAAVIMGAQPICTEQNGKSCRASVLTFITR